MLNQPNSLFLIYQTKDGQTRPEVQLKDEPNDSFQTPSGKTR